MKKTLQLLFDVTGLSEEQIDELFTALTVQVEDFDGASLSYHSRGVYLESGEQAPVLKKKKGKKR